MKTYEPLEGVNTVEFAAPGVDSLVVVTSDGLEVEESEMRVVAVYDEEAGEYADADVEVPINESLIAALDANPHVQERGGSSSFATHTHVDEPDEDPALD